MKTRLMCGVVIALCFLFAGVAHAQTRTPSNPAAIRQNANVVLTKLWEIRAPHQDWLGLGSTERGLTYNPETGNLIIASRLGGVNPVIVDAGTGVVRGRLDSTGIAGGTFPYNQIKATADGQIFTANLTIDSRDEVKIYRWANEESSPERIYSGRLAEPDSARFGDALGVYGSGDDVTLLLSGSFPGIIAKFAWDGRELVESAEFGYSEPVGRGGFSSITLGGDVYASGTGVAPRAIRLADGMTNTTLTSPDITPMDLKSVMHVDIYTGEGETLVAAGPSFTTGQFYLFRMTVEGSTLRLLATFGPLGENANTNNTGGVVFDQSGKRLFLMDSNNALVAYSFN